MKGVFILSHGALRKENQFFRRKHTDHKKTQRNETTGTDRKSTRLNSSHKTESRMPSSA